MSSMQAKDMANFRVRFRFNPGRTGAPLDKLGDFAVQTERFLRSLSHDLGLPTKKGQWLATNFTNESVAFDSEFAEAVAETDAAKGAAAIEMITGDRPLEACERRIVGLRTVAEFAQIAKVLDPDEQFLVGLYKGKAEPEWRNVTYKQIAALRSAISAPIVSYGSVQGTIHSWTTGSQKRFFQLRELAGGGLIRCNYKLELHEKVLRAHEVENTVIHAYGHIKWERTTTEIIEVDVQDIELTKPLSASSFNRLFGSLPDFTGDLSTSDYIEWMRGGGE